MKQTILVLFATSLFFACKNSSSDNAPSSDSAAKKNDTTTASHQMPDSATMMKAWMNYMTPGPMHKWMEKTNGTWEAEVSQWMDPKAPPTKAKATNVQTSGMGGRFVMGKFTSTMMGQPFEGMSTMGYDNAKKMFVSNSR